ncbi:MAG: ATP-dependent sacrificial sulfur transferase LarE [Pyrinomonadaceae bacterium]
MLTGCARIGVKLRFALESTIKIIAFDQPRMIASLEQKPHSPATGPAREKEQKLRDLMRNTRRVLVAYSGGVDSTYLAFIANQELGSNAVCVLGISPSVSQNQQDDAATIAAQYGFNFRTEATYELDDLNYRANLQNRCYFCKTELYATLRTLAKALAIAAIVDGTNFDDTFDHRPGRMAASEKDVASPLADVGMTKREIRELSRDLGLSGWDKPSSPCLSSRIAYGVPVTIERLSKVESAEAVLRKLGIREFRVRVHDDLVRLEIAPNEMKSILDKEIFDGIVKELKKLGFRYVTLDMEGFRSGSMNNKV